MLMAHANIEVEHVLVSNEEWPALKGSMPNEEIPCLEMSDGTKLGKANAIMILLGKKYGYYPDDPM